MTFPTQYRAGQLKVENQMCRHPHVIDDELEGYEAVESWTANVNASDFTTIFRRVAMGGGRK